MGVETALIAGALIGGGSAIFGANESRKARKSAEREAGYQREAQTKQANELRAEQARLDTEQKAAKKKLNQGLARSNRARIRGGLFGEGEQTPGKISATLG